MTYTETKKLNGRLVDDLEKNILVSQKGKRGCAGETGGEKELFAVYQICAADPDLVPQGEGCDLGEEAGF